MVQEISEEDAVAEGIHGNPLSDEVLEPFADLWNSIYEKKGLGWDANPWVWVIEFRKVEV